MEKGRLPFYETYLGAYGIRIYGMRPARDRLVRSLSSDFMGAWPCEIA